MSVKRENMCFHILLPVWTIHETTKTSLPYKQFDYINREIFYKITTSMNVICQSNKNDIQSGYKL